MLANELNARWEMKRLIPIYSLQKVVQAWIFGGNLMAWSICLGLLGTLTAMLLYGFLRLTGYSSFEAFAFALISVLGEQSILWWRLIHGEGVGMLLSAAALLAMGWRIRTNKLRYELAFSLLMTLALLAKESFVLTVPAFLLMKVCLTCQHRRGSLVAAAEESLISIVWLAAASLTSIVR